MENTSTRLRKLMNERNLKQVDIINKAKPYCQKYNVKLGRNDLSQYLSGKVEPGQKKLTVLALTLNVNESWLMGLDVPMEREMNAEEIQKIITFGLTLSELLKYYNITKEELSGILKVNLSFFNDTLNNTKLPDDNDIKKIANYFGIIDKNDLFNGNKLSELMEKYQEINTTPDDKYKFGFVLENMFEKISNEINVPLSELKKFFKNTNKINTNPDLISTYDDLKEFFINYFKSKDIIDNKDENKIDKKLDSIYKPDKKTIFNKDGVEITIAHNGKLNDKMLLEINNLLLNEKIIKEELKETDTRNVEK